MATNESYDALLNRSWGEIPEPKTLPVGSWLLKGRNVAYLPAKGEGNPRVLFFYTPKEPMDDVRPEELAELGDDYDYANNQIVKTIWVESNRDWATVKAHLALHGVDVSNGRSQKDTFKDFKGTEVIAYLETKAFTTAGGETKIDNDPVKFAKVE